MKDRKEDLKFVCGQKWGREGGSSTDVRLRLPLAERAFPFLLHLLRVS